MVAFATVMTPFEGVSAKADCIGTTASEDPTRAALMSTVASLRAPDRPDLQARSHFMDDMTALP
jgi:hypothetical protein